MEIKQETSEKTFKIEIDNETSVHPLNAFKIEIKEEPKREGSYQEFNYLDFKEFPVKTKAEQEQDEYKLTLLEEKQTTNEEKRKPIKELKELPIGKPFPMHSAKVVNGQFGETVLLDLGLEVVFLPPRVTEVYQPAINTLCGEKYCLIFEGEVDVRKARPLLSFRITEN
ncbi:uncharacterized protein LOC126881239 isoform X2 [Diabrotica virgifera virgifera]|uniref:DNA-directed RNA polymerase III subunit RPC4-like n=1 Tax=Diabrotica virgifera virgifera TaxID=50390 RepID=A0ABM5JTT2_DIAVI|nr:uncharacterized protein LOC126881239 isoform X2 [Diabrotica virgifera virgifera]